MNRAKYSIVIIEPSEILHRGLSDSMSHSFLFVVSVPSSDLSTYTSLPISKQHADIIMINPSFVPYGKTIKQLFPMAKVVAIAYNYIHKEMMSQFDECVELYDKSPKIYHKLEQIVTYDETNRSKPHSEELSEREREILIAVAKGLQNKEIATLYNISIHTVMAHRKNISRKTGIKSVYGFVVYAMLNNLIDEYESLDIL